MDESKLSEILRQVAEGKISVEEAITRVQSRPSEKVADYAVIDNDREKRTGFPEVIFAQNKTDEQIVEIFKRLHARNPNVLASRVNPEVYARIQNALPQARYDAVSHLLYTEDKAPELPGVTVVTAGTSDIPVAEEAALTAELMNCIVERIYDVGVSGLHRLLERLPEIRKANVIIVVAGMEGALPTVVGGLVAAPVIAVPTSVGYGASFHGLSALLSMLNSCANSISVVNIDNGYGAGCIAARINRLIHQGGIK